MISPDDPTKPLPTGGEPNHDVPTEPLDPVVAPHVPVADVRTAELSAFAEPTPPGRGSRRVAIVGGIAVVAATVAVVTLATLQRGDGIPEPATTTTSPVAPSPSVPAPSEDKPPATPAPQVSVPAEPTVPREPEPTTPPEQPDPTPEPTP